MSKKDARNKFREAVFKRDGNKCRACGCRDNLAAHHICDRDEMPGGGYVEKNGITLCERCHLKAEAWHLSGNTSACVGFHPDQLYALIKSSHREAYEASLVLLEPKKYRLETAMGRFVGESDDAEEIWEMIGELPFDTPYSVFDKSGDIVGEFVPY